MLELIDFYKILQVDPEAHPAVIRAAYRVLAQIRHPDTPTGSDEKMVALNQAWSVLSDREKRATYDRSRAALAPRAMQASRYAGKQSEDHKPAGPGSRARRSSVLDFGRYQGWSIEQLARHDPDFLEWLARMPIGRSYQSEIETVLAAVRPPVVPDRTGKRRA